MISIQLLVLNICTRLYHTGSKTVGTLYLIYILWLRRWLRLIFS